MKNLSLDFALLSILPQILVNINVTEPKAIKIKILPYKKTILDFSNTVMHMIGFYEVSPNKRNNSVSISFIFLINHSKTIF